MYLVGDLFELYDDARNLKTLNFAFYLYILCVINQACLKIHTFVLLHNVIEIWKVVRLARRFVMFQDE